MLHQSLNPRAKGSTSHIVVFGIERERERERESKFNPKGVGESSISRAC